MEEIFYDSESKKHYRIPKDIFKKESEKEENWDDSMDGVLYSLRTFGTAGNDETTLLVAATLLIVPKKIREKILDDVIFIYTNDTAGGVAFRIPKMKEEQSVILLNFRGISSKERKMDIIAHEIAHIILGHDSTEFRGPAEKAADDLSEKWGFTGVYKDYGPF